GLTPSLPEPVRMFRWVAKIIRGVSLFSQRGGIPRLAELTARDWARNHDLREASRDALREGFFRALAWN
ncbi:MAG TPA: hypothetical protein VL361_01100, partial [Candidatus Limnocylindrales bacterium]|nr:hypothetical protein [Candidatus Limnocylindrales bacterium]